MSNKIWIAIVLILFAVIAVMAWFLFTPIAPHQASPTTTTATTSPDTTATNPEGVIVMQPQENAIVGETFDVSGKAPNTWYYEAVFPIQVRDSDDNLIGSGQAQAQSDWTVASLVPFRATITIQDNYSGSATLILLKDNPSGLPQNEDELTEPITIQ
ncbi:MAG TPA: Gmad2 immunoglobulin-like domain-containing protein [Candidatus Paceibacterota bacterium]|nr:Gmad2 immunoglobulin-like domain-containing protein [Candidatus Paceibacterota bacterium]